jgi:hypothetical protein
MIKNNQWVYKFIDEFETELEKTKKQARKELGVEPDVKIDYVVNLSIKVTGTTQGPFRINVNSSNAKKSLKPNLAAKRILAHMSYQAYANKNVPHLRTRLYSAKYKVQGKPESYWKPSYMNAAQHANMFNPPTTVEKFLHPGISKQLEKELAKIT